MMTQRELITLVDQGRITLHRLSRIVSDGLQPPPGAYAVFHYNGQALAHLQNCRMILSRLFSGQRCLNEIDNLKVRFWSGGRQLSAKANQLIKEDKERTEYMTLDFESFYIFGTILLDQWALEAICIGNLDLYKRHPFNELIIYFENGNKGCLYPIWDQLKEDILWLNYQIKFYRNKFVAHANRPWQKGTTRSVIGESFKLITITPPGWIDEDSLYQEIKGLIHLAKQVPEVDDNNWEKKNPRWLIEILFANIGNIKQKCDRENIAKLFSKIGGSTPTFQILAEKIFSFVLAGTKLLCTIATDNLHNINLGKPFRIGRRII